MTHQYDVLVIGAGHAGTEAALAAARLGARVCLLTTNLDTVGQMSCNPAIGGVGKGQIAREIDALGGAMGQATDASGIQFRLLNRRKGPAMHGPRAQTDKKAYQQEIKRIVEEQDNLHLRQDIVEDILVETGPNRNARVTGVRVRGDVTYRAGAVILTTGTFLQALMHTGEATTPGGRAGEGTTNGISQALWRFGFRIERFKTGTPPRLNGRTINFDRCEIQTGDDVAQPFSFLTDRLQVVQVPCWITYTNQQVHDVIRANLHRAPMYSGQIKSGGPRYCPSIEDKVVRFAEKTKHRLFIEPEGRATHEMYINGIPTSLPRDVQETMLHLIAGLENAQVMRYGYAVEYDYCPPDQLRPWLETKTIDRLFFAGQINGTTGYEEAGAQGLVAGANAALLLRGDSPWVLSRDEAYIGVLVDDLVTRGVDEPYRMFTSRAEYRMRLRQDNADRRLTRLAARIGLVGNRRRQRWQDKENEIARVTDLLETQRTEQVTLTKFLRRPEADWNDMVARLPQLAEVSPEVAQQVVYDVKYAGYVARQDVDIARQERLANKPIPASIDYETLPHLRTEAREKLSRIRPISFAQAGRISGITPADLALLAVYLDRSRQAPKGKPSAQPS